VGRQGVAAALELGDEGVATPVRSSAATEMRMVRA
jgi:hypothetical protein